MTETVSGHGKFDRNKGFVVPLVELAPFVKHIGHHGRAAGQRQKLVQYDPLVVVARVADQCCALRVARQVVLDAAAFHQQFGRMVLVVQMGRCIGAAAVNIVQRERWRAKVGNLFGVGLSLQAGRGVEGDVVVDELPEKCHACGHRRVVDVVGAQDRVRDQLRRAGRRVLGIHRTTGFSQRQQRLPNRWVVRGEWWQGTEHTTKFSAVVIARPGWNEIHCKGGAVLGHDCLLCD